MYKKLYIPVVLLIITTVVLELLNIHLSGILASDSTTVKKLQYNISKLQEENRILQTKVFSLTSFETISSRAAELGFSYNNKYISLRKSNLSYTQ